MELTVGSLIGIALATMFFGYFFGLFEGRAQGYRRRKKEEPLERQASVAAGNSAPEPAQTSGTLQPGRANAWLQLYADREGRPSLDLDGKRVDTSRLTSEQYQRLIQLMVVIRPWVESGTRAADPGSAPEAAEAAARPGIEPGGSAEGGASGSKLPASTEVSSATAVPADPSAPTSMVAQIDSILQARLQGTALASRAIRLAVSRDGGVLVFVGQQSYTGVSDVPDPEVQTAIRAAISDWEKRYTPQ